MTVPGIGPIISSAMVAAIGNGAAFARGRDFSAWLGLVPKQMELHQCIRPLNWSNCAPGHHGYPRASESR
jgi:hypothetical protein